MDEFNLNAIRRKLHSPDSHECYAAIRTVINAIPNAAPLLEELYTTYLATESAPCGSAAYIAIRQHKSIAVLFLLKLMESPRSIDRQNAIHLLHGLGHDRSSWRISEQILDDRPDSQPDWNSQRDKVLQKLKQALPDLDSDVKVLAATTLDDINETPDSIVNILVDGLTSNQISIQQLAALHLGRLGSLATSALPSLAKFIQSNTAPTSGADRPVLAAQNAMNRINGI